jgi:PIN domain nuclease of toxin-antitoxin system
LTTVLLDSHVLHWLTAEPDRLSAPARDAIGTASDVTVSDVTWYELAWLGQSRRIVLTTPVLAWLQGLAANVRTIPVTPAIAATGAALPTSFPRDSADRLIYATAIEHGWPLVTKDERLRSHPYPRSITLW